MIFHARKLLRCTSHAALLSSSMALLLSSAPANAGFEWVPSAQKAPVPAVEKNDPKEPPVMDEIPLALPEAKDLLPPAESSGPSALTPEHTAAGENKITSPTIKTKSFGIEKTDKTAEPKKTENIILPEDAPLSARAPVTQETTEPPTDSAMPMPETLDDPIPYAQESVSSPQDSSMNAANTSFEVIEGFGENLPLALALKEVVPEGYATAFSTRVNPASYVSWNGGKAWPNVISDMIAPLGLRAELRGTTVYILSNTMGAADDSMLENAIEPASGEPAPETPEQTLNLKSEDSAITRRTSIKDPGENSGSLIQALPLADLPEHAAAQTDFENTNSIKISAAEAEDQNKPVEIIPAQARATGDSRLLWEARKGDSLKKVLSDWTSQAKVDLLWQSAQDYTIESDILLTGDLQRAIKTMFAQGLKNGKTPLMSYVTQDNKSEPDKVIILDEAAG